MKSLNKLETFWLKDGRFLVGSSQPSIADLSLVCEIMQLEVILYNQSIYVVLWVSFDQNSICFDRQLLSDEDRDRIFSPYKKVVEWMEDTISATAPHFHEVHGLLFKAQKRIRGQMLTQSEIFCALSKI